MSVNADDTPKRHLPYRTRAWLTLLLLPISFIASMVAGEAIASAVLQDEGAAAPI